MEIVEYLNVLIQQKADDQYTEADNYVKMWTEDPDNIKNCIDLIKEPNNSNILQLLLGTLFTLLKKLFLDIQNDISDIINLICPLFQQETIQNNQSNWLFLIDILAYLILNCKDRFPDIIEFIDSYNCRYLFLKSYIDQMNINTLNHRPIDAQIMVIQNQELFLSTCASEPNNPNFLSFISNLVSGLHESKSLEYLYPYHDLICANLINPQNSKGAFELLFEIVNNFEECDDKEFVASIFITVIGELNNQINNPEYQEHILQVWSGFLQPSIFIEPSVDFLKVILQYFQEHINILEKPTEDFASSIESFTYSFTGIMDNDLENLFPFIEFWITFLGEIVNSNSEISICEQISNSIRETIEAAPDITIEYLNNASIDAASLYILAIWHEIHPDDTKEFVNQTAKNLLSLQEKPFTIFYFMSKCVSDINEYLDQYLEMTLKLMESEQNNQILSAKIIFEISKNSPELIIQYMNDILGMMDRSNPSFYILCKAVFYALNLIENENDISQIFEKLISSLLENFRIISESETKVCQMLIYFADIIGWYSGEPTEFINSLWKNFSQEVVNLIGQKYEEKENIFHDFAVFLINAIDHKRFFDMNYALAFALNYAKSENNRVKSMSFNILKMFIPYYPIEDVFNFFNQIDFQNDIFSVTFLAVHLCDVVKEKGSEFFNWFPTDMIIAMLAVKNPGVVMRVLELTKLIIQYLDPATCANILSAVFQGFLNFYEPAAMDPTAQIISEIYQSEKLSPSDVCQIFGGVKFDNENLNEIENILGNVNFNTLDLVNQMKAYCRKKNPNVLILRHSTK
ncbi:hypothetical protein TVAG_363130 [Trichomonas vaginalis G3]|uniref:Uncharacterized protein n=1 Tax=Trichomonas vaginalis (strain ATCC PRA-98 / G3) TaxID=412133 RepID=A2FQH5_TRIV3|nr:armadillo (ARM) repeat-containing protein family [Trichomonas vaginalis G3]EAX92836.1 hypothetical protein TVAG_363130 [Trichomonas vaginalis G3]KAI5499398.1 armadillo (ARM) repeat-containing protein family [Trichomonas vaginalis G3]|eukprot:XP_001305766.1 hypothetical protein [Trichomonas vaginalis G3]